jgi:predicted unusual protein kinase regulating ubiquinone biosynthesis (AarF/ABC1/UbiB family)
VRLDYSQLNGATMGFTLKPKHLGHYRELAQLLMKYGRSDLVKRAGLEESLAGSKPDDAPLTAVQAEAKQEAAELAKDLEKLGPTYIKLGQLLSTRADILPPMYLEALEHLQDDLEPFPYAQVEEIIERELGARISKLFSEFEVEPIAAASLGQVHRARLRDGRRVAVKIQRPDIQAKLLEDLDALGDVAQFLDDHTEQGRRYTFSLMLEQFRRSIMRELDYTQEANNLRVFRENLKEYPLIVIPAPIADYCTAVVLTMEFVPGVKVTKLSPLRRTELDGDALGRDLIAAYFKQILVDGVFHADPHPGNVFLTEDDRIALIDLGMVGYLSTTMREQLLKLMLAVAEGRGEDVARISMDIGEVRPEIDEDTYVREVSQLVAVNQHATVGQMDIGLVILELTRISGENGVRLPSELTMLGKTLLNIDRVAKTLAPHFDVNESIRSNAASVMRKRMLHQASPTNALSALLEMNDFMQRLPTRLNRVLDRVADNELSLHVDAIDEVELIAGMQKIANRITMGLVLAALIIGAAMLMQVRSSWTILGYPGIAIILFLAAVAGGIFLVVSIWTSDRKPKAKPKE